MRFNKEGDVAAALQQLQPPIVALRCGHPLTLTWMSVSVWYRSRCYVNSRLRMPASSFGTPQKMSSCHVLGVWLFVLFKMSIQPGVSLLRLASHLQKTTSFMKDKPSRYQISKICISGLNVVKTVSLKKCSYEAFGLCRGGGVRQQDTPFALPVVSPASDVDGGGRWNSWLLCVRVYVASTFDMLLCGQYAFPIQKKPAVRADTSPHACPVTHGPLLRNRPPPRGNCQFVQLTWRLGNLWIWERCQIHHPFLSPRWTPSACKLESLPWVHFLDANPKMVKLSVCLSALCT